MSRTQTPLIYSCSGCSNLAQLANTLAVRLDRAGIAEMSCIAGVGGDVKSLVKKAQSARPILAIDGCHLHCVKACLERQQLSLANTSPSVTSGYVNATGRTAQPKKLTSYLLS